MCNIDCFHCQKSDCDNDEITDAESKGQDQFDLQVVGERKYGLERKIWKYNHSENGRASRKRYEQSEKGKAVQRRKYQGRIESGKNAEYCRAYYQRQKAKKLKKGLE